MRPRLALLLITLAMALVPAHAGESEEAFWEAARTGDLAAMRRLHEGGVSVDAATRYGATALAYACDRGHLEVVEWLIDQAAKINTQDTFYQFTPLGWALTNEHVEIVELLLAKGATGADQVLQAGAGEGSTRLVAAALASPEIDADMVARALAQARQVEGAAEVVALLEKAEVKPAEHATVVVDPAILSGYAGSYRSEEAGMTIDVRVEEGKLIAQATGQPPLEMRGLAQNRFEAVIVPQVKLVFEGRGGTAERVIVEQGPSTLVFPRVVEVAATPAPAASPAPEEPKPVPPAPAAPATRLVPRNWPAFRGIDASGIADGQGAPTEWDVASGRNVRWKTPIPGLANSSPIIWGDRVFVTTAISGKGDDSMRTGLYGDVDSVDDLSEHTFKVYALDKATGQVKWERTAATTVPGAKRHLKATQANSTPVTDGKHVVALFGSIGLLVCYDVDGNLLWKADVGLLDAGWFYDKSYQWGHASSPVIYRDLVIVQADVQQDPYLGAWKLADGVRAWRVPREEVPSWGTPTIYRGKERDELIANGTTIRGYDPATGKELWKLGPNSEVTVATPVIAHDLFYVTAGYPPVRPIYAIRPGATGDITLPELGTSSATVAWSNGRGGTYMPTPIVYGGVLHTCNNDGRMTVYDAATGNQLYRERIGGGGSFSASPVAADGRLYFANEDGDVYVLRAGAKYDEIAKNSMGEICMATPAISDGLMVVRTVRHVYGLGEPPAGGGAGAGAGSGAGD